MLAATLLLSARSRALQYMPVRQHLPVSPSPPGRVLRCTHLVLVPQPPRDTHVVAVEGEGHFFIPLMFRIQIPQNMYVSVFMSCRHPPLVPGTRFAVACDRRAVMSSARRKAFGVNRVGRDTCNGCGRFSPTSGIASDIRHRM